MRKEDKMNINKWREGQSYWYQYVKVNGYSWEQNQTGLEKLSKNIDINIKHLQECINYYLEH
jgi:hypothetical protein